MKRFACHIPGCTSSYQRKEHLHRHLAQHRGSEISPCPFCDRVFSRHDTMRRHVRQDHEKEACPHFYNTRTKHACQNCRNAKTRCNGRNPCHRCHTKGLRCSSTAPRSARPKLGASGNGLSSMVNDGAHVQKCIELYFEHFHPQWPFLHRSTFSAEHEPPLLLYSVMMVGFWASGNPSSRTAALALHDKIGKTIWQQRCKWDATVTHREPQSQQEQEQYEQQGQQQDQNQEQEQTTKPVSACPIATYQGILLYLIFSLMRARQRHPDANPDVPLRLSPLDNGILSALVWACRRRNLFYYPRMLSRYSNVDSMACLWVGVEEIKRFAIALFKLCRLCDDASACEDETLVLSDLQFPVPDGNYLWEAESNEVLAKRLAEGGDRGATRDSGLEENWISNRGFCVLSEGDFGFD